MTFFLKKLTKSNERVQQLSKGGKFLEPDEPSSNFRRQSFSIFRKKEKFTFDGGKHQCEVDDLWQTQNEKVLGGGIQTPKRPTLEDLKQTNPPGFKEFQAAVGSQALNEDVALLLWEDIFKPLYTFDLLQTDPKLLETELCNSVKNVGNVM